jgi:hypothetical protein
MNQGDGHVPDVDVDENFRQRPSYQEGYLTDEPDLSIYDLPEGDETDLPESEEEDE